jgi:hypothetical protein
MSTASSWVKAISPGLAMGPPACSFRSGTAVPELGHVQAGVEHRGRVDRAFLPVVTDGGLQVVAAAHGQVVAAVAGDEARLGQAGIEPQLLAQFHHGRVLDHGRRDGLDGFLRALCMGGQCQEGGRGGQGCNEGSEGGFHCVLPNACVVNAWCAAKAAHPPPAGTATSSSAWFGLSPDGVTIAPHHLTGGIAQYQKCGGARPWHAG